MNKETTYYTIIKAAEVLTYNENLYITEAVAKDGVVGDKIETPKISPIIKNNQQEGVIIRRI